LLRALYSIRSETQWGRGGDRVNEQTWPITVGADKLFQENEFIPGLRERKVIPHVAEYELNPHWPNWLTEPERQAAGYAIRQRKVIEKMFGWARLDSFLRQVKVRGVKKVNWLFRLPATAANLVRLVKLIPAEQVKAVASAEAGPNRARKSETARKTRFGSKQQRFGEPRT
jgi:hypothetical protein